jgi:hypothetical protein
MIPETTPDVTKLRPYVYREEIRIGPDGVERELPPAESKLPRWKRVVRKVEDE